MDTNTINNSTNPAPTELAAADTRNDIWENNHRLITEAIANCLQMNERMPNKTELADKTGLNRSTIHRHLKDFDSQPELQEKEKEFRIMFPKVLAAICKYALNGDTKSAKLYFEMIGKLNR